MWNILPDNNFIFESQVVENTLKFEGIILLSITLQALLESRDFTSLPIDSQ